MRIVRQSSTRLTLKTGGRTRLFLFGLILLMAGLLIVTLIKVSPLSQSELPPALRLQPQHEAADQPEIEEPSAAKTGFRLAYYVGRLTIEGARPVVLLGLVSLAAGALIIAAPNRGKTVTFDKSRQQVILTEPRWFFRSGVRVEPLENISEVRVERDRSPGQGRGQNCRVGLVISHSEGAPLTRNYTFYRTVFPLSDSYRYDYETAREMAARLRAFLQP